MKNKLTLLVLVAAIKITAQPVIQNANNIPMVGTSASVSVATVGPMGGSSPGPQVWDFSALTFSAFGTANVIAPSSSSLATSFSTANYAYTLGGYSTFFKASATKMEVQAYSISSAGSGNDYSPNPRTVLKFPFNYLDSQTDTWQKVNGSTNNVTITYEGYGTLVTPTTTYTNIVRIKEDYGNGAIDYQWYLLIPLTTVMVYDHNTNSLYYTAVAPLIDTGTGQQDPKENTVTIFPNPAKDKISIQFQHTDLSQSPVFLLRNSLGQPVKEIPLYTTTNDFRFENLAPGVYFYQVKAHNGRMSTGKLVIE